LASIDVQAALQDAVNRMVGYLPEIIAAIIILVVGYYVGKLVARAVNSFINRTLEKAFEKTDVGKSFREAGIDLSNLTGGLVEAFIIVIAIVLAIQTSTSGGWRERCWPT
jgi:large-conductance mechanosensitive channel